MRYTIYVAITLLIGINTMNGVMSAIVTNTETKVFKVPNSDKVLNYKFENREIIFIDAITNIKGENWYYFKRRPKKIKGWITGEFGIVYTNENDVINSIISNRLYSEYHVHGDNLFDVKVMEYKNNYYSLSYQRMGELEGEKCFSVFINENGKGREVISDWSEKTVVFVGDFVILYEKDWIKVYNSKKLTSQGTYEKTYELFSSKLERNEDVRFKLLVRGSLTFDEKSGVLVVSLDYNSGAKKEFVFIFTNGIFVPSMKR